MSDGCFIGDHYSTLRQYSHLPSDPVLVSIQHLGVTSVSEVGVIFDGVPNIVPVKDFSIDGTAVQFMLQLPTVTDQAKEGTSLSVVIQNQNEVEVVENVRTVSFQVQIWSLPSANIAFLMPLLGTISNDGADMDVQVYVSRIFLYEQSALRATIEQPEGAVCHPHCVSLSLCLTFTVSHFHCVSLSL